MTNYLLKRGGRYYFRRKIPLELLGHYNGRKELVNALGTADPVEAGRLARAEAVRTDREFDSLREAMLPGPPPNEGVYDPVLGKFVLPIVEGYAFDLDLGKYVPSPPLQPMTPTEARAREEYERWVAYEGAEELAQLEIQDQAREIRIEESKEALRRLLAEGVGLPQFVPPQARNTAPQLQAARDTTATPLASSSSVHLATIAERWANERKPDVRSVNAANLVVTRFYSYVGRIAIDRITRAHVVLFKDKLLESGQTGVNTDKQLTQLRALLSFATQNLLAGGNAAHGVKVGERQHARAARLPFDVPALRAIFSGPVYARGERPDGGAGEAAYWLPLLGLFTGARIEELCQLRPEDIYEEEYSTPDGDTRASWVLRITDEGEGQGVKNAASVRRIPIHAELLDRGFVGYATSQRGSSRIFPRLKPDNKGAESGNWSKWFSKYLRRTCKVENRKMVFHSFRHLFKDLCRTASISEEVSDALSGHSSGKVSRRYGGLNYPLAPLVEAMAKVRVVGLVLPDSPRDVSDPSPRLGD
jgi:integrase